MAATKRGGFPTLSLWSSSALISSTQWEPNGGCCSPIIADRTTFSKTTSPMGHGFHCSSVLLMTAQGTGEGRQEGGLSPSQLFASLQSSAFTREGKWGVRVRAQGLVKWASRDSQGQYGWEVLSSPARKKTPLESPPQEIWVEGLKRPCFPILGMWQYPTPHLLGLRHISMSFCLNC